MSTDHFTTCSSADYVTRCSCQADQQCGICDPSDRAQSAVHVPPTPAEYIAQIDKGTTTMPASTDVSTYIVHSLDITRLTRPTHVSHGTIGMLIAAMRDYGRHELVHYAGAAHRDLVAWELCLAWLAAPDALESLLRARALNAAGWGPITDSDIRAANPSLDVEWLAERAFRCSDMARYA